MVKIKDKLTEFENKFGKTWDELLSDELAKARAENGTEIENASEREERAAGEPAGENETAEVDLAPADDEEVSEQDGATAAI